ncbi:MAG: cold-shock protein [Candidatus Lokiarchaeota archaeon]|nr:cold-shock protein [Candidatus Lokiarchaeota archaeon]MBD3200174.1 cold-shock protein [Candidatus Lokiarchaeota archaeon]
MLFLRKGYGFISLDDHEDVFVHYSNILMDGFKKLDQGDQVKFELNENDGEDKGPEALNVEVIAKDRRF